MQDPEANIRCWGGEKMEKAGGRLVKHYRDLAFMGFVEVVKHLGTILANIRFCKEDISYFQPDVLVFIDYPGFNMRIASWAKTQGIRTLYYISPQVWAWKANRVRQIKRDVDEMLVILPFEVEFYKKWNHPVTYVGHPLIEAISEAKQLPIRSISDKPVIALLPGSRLQEIRAKLPVMLQMVARFPDFQFVIAGAPSMSDNIYHDLIGKESVLIVRNDTYNLLRQSRAALVTSGTATLETGLFNVPQVVCYRGNPMSFWLAKCLVKVKYISLVNLIMERQVVRELIQDELNTENLTIELNRLLFDAPYRGAVQQGYEQLWRVLGSQTASIEVARATIRLASK